MGAKKWFEAFAAFEAAGSSPTYERLSYAIAADDRLLALIAALPEPKQQPNLLFAACQLLGAPMGSPTEETFAFIHDRWPDLREVISSRSTQTNEPARTGAFLPLLAAIDGPLALIEVGCSAGLCLYPDRYAITYDDLPVGPTDSPVRFPVKTHGPVPVSTRCLDVVARIGIDLNPLDVRRQEHVDWLDACIWPEHIDRRRRLRAAAALVAADPPELVQGDLVDAIDDVLGALPRGAHAVVFHSAVLGYLQPEGRVEFAHRLRRHTGATWLSNEAPGVVASLSTSITPPADRAAAAYFVLGVDGTDVVGLSDPHGTWLQWRSDHTQVISP